VIVDPVDVDRRIERKMLELRIDRDARRALDAQEGGPIVEPEILTLRERLKRPRVTMTTGSNAGKSRDRACCAQRSSRLAIRRSRATTSAVWPMGTTGWGKTALSATSGVIVDLDFEMSEAQQINWLRDQKIRRDDKVIPISMRGSAARFNILDPDIRREWAKRLRVLGTEAIVWIASVPGRRARPRRTPGDRPAVDCL
jgi:hypothetical protein